MVKKTFKVRDRSKCRMQKLITLYAADLQAKRLVKNPQSVPENRVFNTISAIQKIRETFLPEFKEYWDIM